ncbi:uncharacterized protein (TIGR02611 family) [Motilibacter rhizosphaerae]|uniref:Uncharacterized protein (TIGR02611 family) n=1 Tax=Motilibacter rhizosphaerae TaxID=598652 RepID=A0A4Q7NRR3_9ACTN|nr:PGPGW domain-containing protein [Motilibacter rhizosphaerae]RZS89458.1 uncharacterized protein (TIGR02611 family) [Motilibacter rhizosphaerae]
MGDPERAEAGALAPAVLPTPTSPSMSRRQRYVLWRDRATQGSRWKRSAWRAVVTLVGLLLVGGGLALVPLPGPGWLVVILGLGVLSTEFVWAERLLGRLRALLDAWAAWVRGRSPLGRALVGAVGLVVLLGVAVVVLRLLGTPGWVPEAVPLVR